MHVSPTQVRMFLRCMQQWWFRYVAGIKLKPNVPMAIGTAVHKAIERNLKAKATTGRPERLDTLLGIVEETISSEFDFVETSRGESKETLIKDAAKALEFHYNNVAPKIAPAAVDGVPLVEYEKEIEFENRPWTLKVVVDAIDKKGIVIDTKVSSKKLPEIAAEIDFQLKAGSFVYLHTLGSPPNKVRFDRIIKGKAGYELQQLSSKAPTEDDLRTFLAKLDGVAQIMQLIMEGRVKPIPIHDPYVCSWCGYAPICLGKDLTKYLRDPSTAEGEAKKLISFRLDERRRSQDELDNA